MAGMLQLITSTELPGNAAALAGSTWPMGTRLPVKGTHQPAGDFHCPVTMMQLGGEWDLKRESGKELGGVCCLDSISSVCEATELAAKSLTWIFELTPTVTVGYHCVQTTAGMSSLSTEKNQQEFQALRAR